MIGAALVLALAGTGEPAGYTAGIEAWRSQREARLRAEDGWLAVAGLFWLDEGAAPATIGSAPDSELVLPDGPKRLGAAAARAGRIELQLAAGSAAQLDGKAAEGTVLLPPSDGKSGLLRVGRLTLFTIARSGKLGLRLRDPEAATRRDFAGLDWYPVNEVWRITARFEPYPEPREIKIPNVLGQRVPLPCPGEVVFTVAGRELRLLPVIEEPGADELFFVFRDATSGQGTYGSGRFLYAPLPVDGKVVLDFNKAYSPPCAFTPYATCPLPPDANKLPIAVGAGERFAGHH